MSQLFKTVNAEVRLPSNATSIVVLERGDLEGYFRGKLHEFLTQFDFAGQYSNFGNVRIEQIHPFALLLFADIMGTAVETNLFPSITVADSEESGAFDTLSRGVSNVVLDEAAVRTMLGHVDAGRLLLSSSNRTRLLAAVQNGGTVVGRRISHESQHTVDFNIWADNKDITSAIYEVVHVFLALMSEEFHLDGYHTLGDASGHRAGDVNVEFGRILYGANVRVPIATTTGALLIEMPFGSVDAITATPAYHTTGGQ